MKSLFKTVALLTIFSVITRIAGFLFKIYLSRAIGAENLGLYQIAFSVFIVLLTIVSSGLPLTISKLAAKYKTINDNKKQYSAVSSALIIGGIASLVLCLIILLFNKYINFLFPDGRCIYILLSLLPAVVFSSAYSVLRGVMMGHNNFLTCCIVELFEQIARIIICVFLLSFVYKNVEGSLIAGISLSIACMLSFILITIIYFKKGNKLYNPKGTFNEVLKSSTPITSVRLLSSLVQPLIAFLIPIRMIAAGFSNEFAISEFGIMMGMTFPLVFAPTALIGSLSTALIPDLAAALALDNTKHIDERIQSSITFSFFFSCLCIPAFLALGIPACQFLFNNTQAGVYLQHASLLIIPMSINGLTTSILNSIGLEIKSLKNYLLGAILLLLSIWFLPKYLGVESIIIGMGLCMTTSMILNLKMINKTLKNKIRYKNYIFLSLLILPTYLLTINLYNLLCNIFPYIISLLFSGIISIITFILLCEIFNLVHIKSFFIRVIPQKFKKQTKKLNT